MEPASEGLILVDAVAGTGEEFETSFLERSGHPVVVCNGPADAEVCPILDGRGCEMFNEAHGIIFELDLETEQHRAILQRYRTLAAEGMPIRVVVSAEQAVTYEELLADFEIWTRQPTVADLDGMAAEVEAADRFAEPRPVTGDVPEMWFG